MACNLCDLGAKSIFQLRPEGSNNPDVYVVLDKPTNDDLRTSITSGERGSYIINNLMSVGITNYRIFSILRCNCDRNPTPEEISQCLKFITSDIYRTNPKVIVTAGTIATQSLLGTSDKITNIRGLVRSLDINGKTFQVLPVYSPTYVINKHTNSEVVGEFMGDLATAAKIVTGEYLNPMDRNIIEYALDYGTFYNFYDNNLKGEEMLAYDIETNAKLVYSKDFDICGWSLAKEGVGIYVCLDSLDYHMPEPDRQQCIDLLLKVLEETPKIVVHNSLYERPATYFRYGYELSFEKVEDTLVMAKIMLGGKVGAGLKPNARRIGYPEWDKDLAQYIEGFTKAIKRSSLKRFQPIIQELRNGATFDNVFNILNDKKYDEIQEFFEKYIKESALRYYSESEFEQLVPEISRKFVEGYDNGFTQVIPYDWVPQRMLCKYGATDSLATFDLYNYFMRRFDEDSTDEVDLHKGYYYDLMEHYAGYELMLAGIHWDDESATRDYKAYSDMMLKSLKAMILCNHPAMNDFILRKFIPSLAPSYIYENYNDYFWENFKNRIEMKDESTYVMVDISPTTGKERRRDTKFFFNDTSKIPDSIKRDLSNKILPEAKKIVSKMDVDELKGIFNPASTVREIADTYNSIVLDDDLRVGNFINKIRDNILESEEVDRTKYSSDEQQLIDEIEKYLDIPSTDVDNRRVHYEPLKLRILSLTRMKSSDMQEYLGDMHNFRLEGLSEGSQLEVFESLRTTPIDIDDPTTWTDPFKWNFYLRMYKKSSKIITAYLDGTVGRGSVYAVNKKKLQSGDDVVYREESLEDLGTTDYRGNLPSGDDWLEQSEFGVGTAETGRWRCLSGDTLIPLLDGRILTIKEIYDNDIRDFYVYSYDQITNRIVPGYCKYAHITGNNAEMIEVLLDTGDVIKCTKNHKIVLRDGHKKMAGELVPGDSLMPLNRKVNDEGYELLQQPNGDWELTHRVVMSDKMGSDYSSQARGRHQCHHKDTNRLNNDPRNLAWIRYGEHIKEHTRIHHKKLREDQEYRNQHLPSMRSSCANMRIKREQNPEYRAKICEHNKNLWYEIWTAPEWEEWRERQRNITRESMKKLTDAQHNPENPDYHKYDEWREKNKVQASNLNLARAYNLARDFYEDNGYVSEEGYESIRKRGFMTWTTLTDTLGGVDELVRMIENHERINHQVVAIRDAGIDDTVYDLTVERYHTFCISAGRRAEIFVGNSKFHVIPAGSTVKRLLTSRFPGGTIFQPDFSANELRCVASAAHEKSMLEAFRNGMDIHLANASRVFGIPPEEITPFQRRWAKTLCLTGDTKIKLLSGVSKTIEELYVEYLNGALNEYVYSYHDELNKFIPCKLLGIQQNREETEYVEIELDNGSLIHATKDHPFVMRDGSEKLAEDLRSGDSLMAMYFRDTERGEYKYLGEGYEEFVDPDGNWVPTHHRVSQFVELEKIGEKEPHTIIHHADFNKHNNHPDNLKLVNYRDHMKYHARSEYYIAREAIQKEFSENYERYQKYREYNSADHTTIEEYIAELIVVNYRHSDRMLKKLKECDPGLRGIVSEVMNNKEFIDVVNEKLKGSYHTKKQESGYYTKNAKSFTNWSEDRRKAQSERIMENERYKNGWLAKYVRYIKSLIDNGYEINEKNFNKYRPYATYFRYESLESVLDKPVEELIELAKMLPNQNRELKELDITDVSARGVEHMNDLWYSDNDYAVKFREHHSEVHSAMMTDMNKDENLNNTRNRNKVMRVLRDMMDAGISEDEIIKNGMSNSFDKLKEITGKRYIGYPRTIGKYFDSIEEAVEAAKTYNHRVKSVRVIHSDEPVKFYGMMVNYCHNFLIDLGDSSGVLSFNSFQILYGGGVHSVAQNYFNGDTKRAQEALDAFYGAFPGLRAWLESKRDEVMRTHKISTLTNRFINIDFDPNDSKSVAAAKRAAGNYGIQSFSYDTEILGLDGRSHKIGELADNHEDLWVYSYNTKNNKIVPMKGIQAQCTGTTDTWYEITLDNGESVKVTPEHLMMLRNGTYCRADELQVGQSLMPLYLDRESKVKFKLGRYKFIDGQWIHQWAHDEVYGNIPETQVHHINMNPDDNRPENLIRMHRNEHVAYHRNFYEYLDGNKTYEEFISTATSELKLIYGDRYVERIEDIKQMISEIPDEHRKELAEKSMTYRNKHKSESWNSNQREAVSREVYKRLEESGNVLGMDSEEYKKRLSESWAETHDYRVQRLKEGHNSPEAKKRHSEASKKQRKDPEYIFKQTRRCLDFMLENNLPWSTPEEWDESVKQYPKPRGRKSTNFIYKVMTWDEFLDGAKDYASTYNHKVVGIKIIHLDKPEPKYDLHVPKYHNFALSCGVFSHNSSASTMAAVIFCDILLYMKKHKMKSKGICFIHDSLESDIYPYELIELTKYQQKELATGAIDYFGIECKADVSMGYSMGHECEMTDIEVLDDNYTKAYITLEGFYNDILDTMNHWKLAYHKVEIIEEDLHDQYLSVSEMFIARKAFDPTAMNHHQKGKVKIYIQYYNDNGEIDPMNDHFEPINIWDNAPVYEYIERLNY